MANIVKASVPLLKSNGFRKRRYGFNRRTPDGLVLVVHFWMAPFEPPAWTEIPGLRVRAYGGFRLNFGVWVPEMNRSATTDLSWVNEYQCQLRTTSGGLLAEEAHSDHWWSLEDPAAATNARDVLRELGLPWLEARSSREAILAGYERGGYLPLGMHPAGGLDIADLYLAMGRPQEARRTLEAYVEEPHLRNHVGYLAEHLTARGHGDLVARIHTTAH